MTVIIDPRLDVYGIDGRTGVLADMLEFRALKGLGMSIADLADLIVDMGWTRTPLRQVLMPGDTEDDVPEPLAEQAFNLLSERSEVLGDRYPFERVLGKLRPRSQVDISADPYISILCIAIAHAWNVPCVNSPEAAFEAVVVAAMQRHFQAASMGTGDRAGRTFAQTLKEGATAVGLTASPDPRPVRIRVKDAGVDTLVGQVWPDRRGGQWVFVGQVTCGQTDTWRNKLHEPIVANWRAYLQEPLTPQRFLAVPHHVDRAFFDSLHLADEGLVLDRLRLVLSLASTPSAAVAITSAVLDAAA